MNNFALYTLMLMLWVASCTPESGGQEPELVIDISEMAMLPEAVSNNAVCEGFAGGRPYVFTFGGIDSTKLYSGIHLRSYRYDVVEDSWGQIADLPDTLGKVAAGASRVGNIIYVMGGYHVFPDGHELSSNKVHRYDVDQNKFLEDGAPIPVPIDDHVQAVWQDSLIYVVTGWSDKHNVPDVQIYNPYSNSWVTGTPVPDDNDFKSFGASGTIIGDTIYYFGGARFEKYYPIQNNLRKGVINPKDPAKVRWSQIIPDSTVVGYRMAALNFADYPVWLGGSKITYNYNGISYLTKSGVPTANRVVRLDVSSGMWRTDSLGLPMDLRGIAIVNHENPATYYLVGGMNANQQVSNKTIKLTFAALPSVD